MKMQILEDVILEGFKMLTAYESNSQSVYSIKLCLSLCELKQSGCMWYSRFSEYLLKEEY